MERLHKMALRQICQSTSQGMCLYDPSVSLLNDREVRVGVLRSKHEAEKPPSRACLDLLPTTYYLLPTTYYLLPTILNPY